MPEWLKLLLQQSGSAGMVDTLATLVGAMPYFLPMQGQPAIQQGGQRPRVVAEAGYDPRSQTLLTFLSPYLQSNFLRSDITSAYPGYQPYNPQQSFGEMVVGHEFGHHALTGLFNKPLADSLNALKPKNKEVFADDFQNAIQFLRSNKRDATKLNAKSKQIVQVLLNFAPFDKDTLKSVTSNTTTKR